MPCWIQDCTKAKASLRQFFHSLCADQWGPNFYILEYLMPKIAEVTGETSKATNDALAKAMNKHTAKYQHKFNR